MISRDFTGIIYPFPMRLRITARLLVGVCVCGEHCDVDPCCSLRGLVNVNYLLVNFLV